MIFYQVPFEGVCWRHLLLPLWDDFRSSRHPGPLQQNHPPVLHPPSIQLPLFGPSTLPLSALSEAPSTQIQLEDGQVGNQYDDVPLQGPEYFRQVFHYVVQDCPVDTVAGERRVHRYK